MPNEGIIKYEYYRNGSLKSETDPLGNSTNYYYNNVSQLSKVIDAMGKTTWYEYDNVGNKIEMATANNGQITKYEYDHKNLLSKMTDAIGNIETYTYDLNSNLITKTSKNKDITTNTYDKMNRVKSISVSNAQGNKYPEFTTYNYSKAGSIIEEKNENLTVNSTYDDAGRIIKQTESNGVEKIYTYDLNNNRKSFILKQNGSTKLSQTYDYDNMNRMFKVYESGTLKATYNYDLNGNRVKLKYDPNGVETLYTYNNANLITNLSNKKGTATLSSFIYSYCLDGNQASKTDNTERNTIYTHDGLGRLTNEKETLGTDVVSKTYLFDKASNRQKMTVTETGVSSYTTNYNYDKLNRLLAETKESPLQSETTNYVYDSNGNQISKMGFTISQALKNETQLGISVIGEGFTKNEKGYVAELYSYDAFNRLVKVENDKGLITHKYKPDGMRLSKTVNAALTTHIWDGSNIVLELNGSNAVIGKYTRGIGLISNQDGNFYIFNAHGDVEQLVDSSGKITKNYQYDAFGVESNKDDYLFEYSGYMNITENNLPKKISYTPTWIDPQIGIKFATISDSTVKLTLKITANEESSGQIFWCTDDGNFNGQDTKIFTIKSGTHEYTVDLGKISLSHLRIDAGIQGSPITLSDIKLESEANSKERDTNPFRYAGEYWDKETETIYLRARYYNPATSRMLSEDPIRAGLNWYTYANNNPLRFKDPSGLIPTPVEAADMADHIYDPSDKNKELSGGWKYNYTIDNDEGLKMGVYSRTKDDGTIEYALVNKGTSTSGDWGNNAQQPPGWSDDMKDSISKSKEFVDNHKYNEITMVGHSKGGAESVANAVANNKNSIVFNPATTFLSSYKLSYKNYTASMTVFVVKGEILHSAEGWFSKRIDKLEYLPTQYETKWWDNNITRVNNAIKNHLMGAVKNALKEAGYK